VTRRRKIAGPIDWAAVRERMARANVALESSLAVSAARATELLSERARRLARRDAEAPAGEVLQILTFALGRERYAIETRFVREVAKLSDFTPVPSTPSFVVGIIGFRGDVLALIDLRRFLGREQVGLSDLSRVIVLGLEHAEVGVLADAVDSLDQLPVASLSDAPDSVARIGREHVRGVTRDALILLDGATLLEDPRLVVDDTRAATTT
jgi:purine-binding chemotaxis protein CheW